MKFYFYFFLIFNICISNAQITKVIYKFVQYNPEQSEKELKENKNNIPDFTMDIIKNFIEQTSNQQFELVFDKSSALYFETNALSNSQFSSENDNDIYYKNLKTKEKIFQNKITGSKVNVNIPFNQHDWSITSESRMISGYRCFKAVLKSLQYNPLTKEKMLVDRFVWFTPEIPASFGPQGFDGLPGLVIETAENDKLCLRAVKIEFNLDKNIKIEKPVASKSIKLDEFEAIEKENFKKMQDEMGN